MDITAKYMFELCSVFNLDILELNDSHEYDAASSELSIYVKYSLGNAPNIVPRGLDLNNSSNDEFTKHHMKHFYKYARKIPATWGHGTYFVLRCNFRCGIQF